jgi:hypothetical protein
MAPGRLLSDQHPADGEAGTLAANSNAKQQTACQSKNVEFHMTRMAGAQSEGMRA